MEPADSISRLGFSRWYERRLIEAHAWFISAFICVVAIVLWVLPDMCSSGQYDCSTLLERKRAD